MRMPLFRHFFSNPLVIILSVHLLGAGISRPDYRRYSDGNLPLTVTPAVRLSADFY